MSASKNQPKPFVEPTFEKFFSYWEVKKLLEEAGTVTSWDLNSALGDTIMEKYESLYVKLVEVNNVLISKGAAGFFWIVTTPEVASIFETATSGFEAITSEEWEKEKEQNAKLVGGIRWQGVPLIHFKGSVNKRWRIYTSEHLGSSVLLMGCNDVKEDSRHYAKMQILNYII